jgi:PDZ domain-containing protein
MTNFDPEPKPKKGLLPRIVSWGVSLVLVAGGLYATLGSTPFLVEQPGPVFNVFSTIGSKPMIIIEGHKSYATSGSLNMLTVNLQGDSVRGASWLNVGLAKIDPSLAIVKITDIYPPGWDSAKLNHDADVMMLDSQSNAKAAALNLLGIPFTSSIKVTQVTLASPAGSLLKAGDTLLSVDGQQATGIDQLRAMVAASKGKRPVQIKVERNGTQKSFAITPKLTDGQWRVGIYVQEVPVFPFKINIEVGDVGGPSGGQILALAIYDKLTPGSLTGGQNIAGTGTVDPQGNIGPIGGIRQKMYGALRAGVKYFLAPDTNCDEVVGHIPDGLHVFKVKTLQDSLKDIAAIKSGNTKNLAICTK